MKEEVREEKATKSNDLENLTVAELREMAKDKDVKGYSTMKKAELLDALAFLAAFEIPFSLNQSIEAFKSPLFASNALIITVQETEKKDVGLLIKIIINHQKK